MGGRRVNGGRRAACARTGPCPALRLPRGCPTTSPMPRAGSIREKTLRWRCATLCSDRPALCLAVEGIASVAASDGGEGHWRLEARAGGGVQARAQWLDAR